MSSILSNLACYLYSYIEKTITIFLVSRMCVHLPLRASNYLGE
jgi:hypothetical protein